MARNRNLSRAVYGVFVLFVSVFVVVSTFEVGRTLFGSGSSGTAASPAPAPTVGEACGAAIAREIAVIDAARAAAGREANGDLARGRYQAERGARATAACDGDPHEADALAALARLDRAAEADALREAGDLSPVRLTAQSFIRNPPR